MPFSTRKLGPLLLGITSLVSSATAAPTSSYKNHSSPFSNASWPLPHYVTGDNDTANSNDTNQGWGGIHLHDPSIVLGPDGHYYSFSTHGLTVISRATKKGSIEGYWKILGSVLESGSSIINNTGSTDPW